MRYFAKVSRCKLLVYLYAHVETIFVSLYQDSSVEIVGNPGKLHLHIKSNLKISEIK